MTKNILSLILVFLISSCSFFNDKEVLLPIKSRPSGASIYIDGKYFGETPATVKLVPNKTYHATLVKKGFGSSNIDLESWASVRGGRGADTTRCVLDSLGFMLFIPAIAFIRNCRDFKLSEYVVDIGNNDFMTNSNDVSLEMMDRRNQQMNNNRNPYANNNQSNNPSYGNNYGNNANGDVYGNDNNIYNNELYNPQSGQDNGSYYGRNTRSGY